MFSMGLAPARPRAHSHANALSHAGSHAARPLDRHPAVAGPLLKLAMDNITHTVVGLAVGEVIHRAVTAEATPAAQHTRRRLLLTACAAASNFPDLDLVLGAACCRTRSATCCTTAATPTPSCWKYQQALLLVALLWLLWPNARALLNTSAVARKGLALAVMRRLPAAYRHGRHEFVCASTPSIPSTCAGCSATWCSSSRTNLLGRRRRAADVMTIDRSWLRRGWLVLLALVLTGFTIKGYLHWASLALLALAALLAARQGLPTGLALCVAFISVQALGSHTARGAVLAGELAQRAPGAGLLDAALTAYPANPLCWNCSPPSNALRAGTARPPALSPARARREAARPWPGRSRPRSPHLALLRQQFRRRRSAPCRCSAAGGQHLVAS